MLMMMRTFHMLQLKVQQALLLQYTAAKFVFIKMEEPSLFLPIMEQK